MKQVDQVLIRDNTKENLFTYGRYWMCTYAKNDIVYVQDDDYLVYNIEELIALYDGVNIIANLKEGFEGYYPYPETMVGWGALFNREWLSVFNKWRCHYGEDYLMYRGGDRIFTTLYGRAKTIKAKVKEFPSATDKNIAIYKREDHYMTVEKVRERLRIIRGEK
ncbi:MAG: hypothetical protein WC942_09775 [Clostridia bacterium]